LIPHDLAAGQCSLQALQTLFRHQCVIERQEFQRPQRFQRLDAGIGERPAIQPQLRKPRERRQVRQALIGDGGVIQIQAGEILQAADGFQRAVAEAGPNGVEAR